MSYQVLARKWRPKTFQDMVGQEHVLQALVHALEHNRLHHAYLFTGTRGVGKTTIGRLLARCLNCETGVTANPCGECSSCREILENRFVDLIEIDAASRTGVDDMRELTDNVQYAPTRGRFKVYLIDEVHMLTNQSFNAFLKTLEEPPEHVKFLLATTDPQKLPVTVLSRCLQFNLKRMTPEHIAGHLRFILGEEQIPFEEPALWQLARAADGSMRDALSLTDQAIAFGNHNVGTSDVSSMLGTIDQRDIETLVDALVRGDGPALLTEIERISGFAPDYSAILTDLLSLFHRITLEQVVPGSVDNALGDADRVQALARELSAEDAQVFYQSALIGRKDLAITPDARMGFEMTLLRMLAFRPGTDRKTPPMQAPVQSTTRPREERGQAAATETQDAPEDPAPAASEAALASPGDGAPGNAAAQALIGRQTMEPDPVPGLKSPEQQYEPTPATPNASGATDEDAVEAGAGVQTVAESVSRNPVENTGEIVVESAVDRAVDMAVESTVEGRADSEPRSTTEGVGDVAAEATPVVAPESAAPAPIDPDEAALMAYADQAAQQYDETDYDTGFDLPDGIAEPPRDTAADESQPGPSRESISDVLETVTALGRRNAGSSPESRPAPGTVSSDAGSPQAEAPGQPVQTSRDSDARSSRVARMMTAPAAPLAPEPKSVPAPEADTASLVPPDPENFHWPRDFRRLGIVGMAGNLASQASCEREGDLFRLTLEEGHYRLLNDRHQQRILEGLQACFGEATRLEVATGPAGDDTPVAWEARARAQRQQEAEQAIETDPIVHAIVERFEGRVIKESIRPV